MWEPRKDAVRTAREARCIVNDLLGRVRPGDFVIIDCLYMLLHGGDENSAQTLQPMVMEFDRLLTEGGCSGVLLVHHQAKGASGQKAVIDRGAGSGVVSRFVDNVFSLDYLDADEEDEFVRQAGEQKLRPRRLSCVMRNAEEDESVDFLFGGPRLVTDAGGDLSRHYVSGSPQANGAHSARGNRERAEQDWAAKAELVGAALEEAAREGRVAHARVRVRLLRRPTTASTGWARRRGWGTIRNWLKPGCTSLPFHTEGGVVVPDESGGEGQQEAAHGRAPL
jgi:hypothetical protein